MFYNDLLNFKSKHTRVNNPGKSIPFSRLPKKFLDQSKPLKISTVFGKPFDFVEINLKVLAPVQPFGRPKSCILQGIISGQVTGNAGNIQNTIQNDVLLIPPEKTIRFDGHLEASKKPFKNYHIKRAYHYDMFILPFSFYDSFAPTNRIYPTCYLIIFLGVLRYPFDPWLWAVHDNQPLTFDHIQMTSKNDKKEINLIYAPTFDKQFHSLSMTNHSLSIIFNHFFMFRNDKFYLHILSIYKYIKSSICIYNISAFMDLKKHVVQGVQRGIPFGCIRIYNKLRTYICTYTKWCKII